MKPKSCVHCSFVDHCAPAMEMALRIVLRRINFQDGLAFMEVRAAQCKTFTTDIKLKPRRRERQLKFNFM
jgi:hypothetical protein